MAPKSFLTAATVDTATAFVVATRFGRTTDPRGSIVFERPIATEKMSPIRLFMRATDLREGKTETSRDQEQDARTENVDML